MWSQHHIAVPPDIMAAVATAHRGAVSVHHTTVFPPTAAQAVPHKHHVIYRLRPVGVFQTPQVLAAPSSVRTVIILIKKSPDWGIFLVVSGWINFYLF